MKRRDVGRVVAGATAAGLVGRTAQARLSADAEKVLYEAARADGEFTWYVAHYSTEYANRYAQAFTAKYPGVKVNVVRATSGVVYQRAMQELKVGTPQVDVLGSADIGHYLEMKNKGQLETFRPANGATLLPRLRDVDPDGQYHVTGFGLMGIIYRKDKVKAEDAPKSWLDLADPRWKNQVALSHPAFSGSVATWVVAMTALHGWSYFEKLEKGKPQIGRSLLDTNTMLKTGERLVGIAYMPQAVQDIAKGEPLGLVYPSDGSVLIVGCSAIVKGARKPAAARLFMEFLQSEAFSRMLADDFQEPTRPEVTSRSGVSLATTKLIEQSAADVLKGGPAARERWRDTFGA